MITLRRVLISAVALGTALGVPAASGSSDDDGARAGTCTINLAVQNHADYNIESSGACTGGLTSTIRGRTLSPAPCTRGAVMTVASPDSYFHLSGSRMWPADTFLEVAGNSGTIAVEGALDTDGRVLLAAGELVRTDLSGCTFFGQITYFDPPRPIG